MTPPQPEPSQPDTRVESVIQCFITACEMRAYTVVGTDSSQSQYGTKVQLRICINDVQYTRPHGPHRHAIGDAVQSRNTAAAECQCGETASATKLLARRTGAPPSRQHTFASARACTLAIRDCSVPKAANEGSPVGRA